MKTTTQKIALLIAVYTLLFTTNINAQCMNFGSQYPAAPQTTTSPTLSNVATCFYGGDYGRYNVTNGETYTWTTCGDTDFDTQLSLWNTAHTTSYAYNDDACGLQSTITWTATFTGQVDVLVSKFNCNDENTCMTVQWACITCGGGGGTPPGGGIIPTACANDTYTMTASSTTHFYDDGGPGGNCSTDGAAGNFANAGCETVTTICEASGEYLITEFLVLSKVRTNSGFDWMVINDGPSTSATIIYDNRSGGPNNPDGTSCNYTASSLINCSTGECLTFRFYASSVVNREGWDALMTSTPIPCSPLPVELTFFTGNKTGNINHLSWETATETNNDYFILEHSTDGFSWNEITKEKGAGNSTKINTYFYDHRDFPLAINYYRLTQVDFDGKRETFEIVSIDNSSDRKLIKTVNMIGQEINENYKGVVIDYYDDNTVVKRYQK